MKLIRMLLTALLALTGAVGLTTAAAAAPAGGCQGQQRPGITDVTVNDRTISVSGTVGDPCPILVQIRAVLPTGEVDASSGDLASVTRPERDGTFEATFPRFRGSLDRTYSRFLAIGHRGSETTLLGEPVFAVDLDYSAVNTSPREQPESMKGIALSMTSDAQEVGAEHAAITVSLSDLLLAGPEPGATRFRSGGHTYYFDPEATHSLDGRIKSLSDQGILVYLVLVLVYDDPEENPNSSFPLLVHPDAPEGPPDFFMTYPFDTVTEEGINAYTAAMEFIADRYTRDDEAYGRAMDYVIGNEIDSAGAWQAMGEKTLPEFLDNYIPALRIAWQASQRFHADSRVYTSLDHFWNESANPADPLRFYKGKELLDLLASTVREQGDFPWNLAQHPYPHDMMDPHVWDDPVTEDPDQTPTITFKNISTLSQYMTTPEMTYKGEPRSIILSELGCQSPTNEHEDQVLQAACMSYAYYKASAADGIDAFLWDPQVDNQEAGGLRMGLWTYDEERTEDLNAVGEKKLSYDLYRDIDTPGSLERSEFALDVIGIDSWTDAIPGFEESDIALRHSMTQVGMETGATSEAEPLSSFERGEDGWGPADHVVDVDSVRDRDAAEGRRVLDVDFSDEGIITGNPANNKTWRGTSTGLEEPVDATDTPYLRAALRLEDGVSEDFDADNRLSAQIRVTAADGSVAYGIARLEPEGWNTLHLDLSDWEQRSAISGVTVWVHGTSGEDWNGHFQLDDVAFAGAIAGAEHANLDISAVAGDHDAVGAPVEITLTNQGSAPLAGVATVTACGETDVADPSIDVDGLAGAGASTTHETTLTEVDPANPVLCVDYAGHTYEVAVHIPPAGPTLLYDFEDDAQGWEAGENVESVSQVDSFPNGPQMPHGGRGALEAIMADVDAGEARSVSITPPEPLDLTGASEVYAWVDAYGGVSGADGYEATFTLHSGEDSVQAVSEGFMPDNWNELRVDVADWDGASSVTSMDVSYRVLGADGFVWKDNPRLQVDDVGVEMPDGEATPAWNAAWAAPIGGHFPGDTPADVTYRQMARMSTDGTAVRLRLANTFSEEPLAFDAMTVGLREGEQAATTADPIPVTLAGQSTIEVPAGQVLFTDPVRLDVGAGDDLVISTHSTASLPELSHDFANKTHYVTGPGDHTGDQSGQAFSEDGMSALWVDAVDVYGTTAAGTVAILGDSITDGAGSDLDADNRWPDQLAQRLHAEPPGTESNLAVVNAGIGGNTLAGYGDAQVGENGLSRLDRDVLTQTGLSTAVVFEGTNDIYMGASAPEVIEALETAASRIHETGAQAVVCTAAPRGNGVGWTESMETERAALNEWIRSQGSYDAVIDMDEVLADPDDPTVMLADYDADGTHPSAAGYEAMAAAVDLTALAAATDRT